MDEQQRDDGDPIGDRKQSRDNNIIDSDSDETSTGFEALPFTPESSESVSDECSGERWATGEPIIVGIGASAGGLAALRTFFNAIPPDSGLAYVVVVHLSPDHESHLAEVLQPHVAIPIQQVHETVPLAPNRVYVIPPGKNLAAIDTHLRLEELEAERNQRAPIDHFFRTLARTHKGQSVAVILTGTGSDGSLGIKEIKGRGGLVIVQDPTDAEFDGMPQSAIATGMADLVLPLEAISARVLKLAEVHSRLRLPMDGEKISDDQRQVIEKIFALIRARIGRDFSGYKQSTIMRRLARRMQLRQVEVLGDYLSLLRQESNEVQLLADDLLITVTSFFRDSEVFQRLRDDVIPKLFINKGPTDDVRLWSVGCATGEEAYSIAMLLAEHAARLPAAPTVQIFASDLHERSLAAAREGFYPGDIETDVPPEFLQRYFELDKGGYRIKKEIREMVVFAPHNLLCDPPFSRIDLIACRNVLIYLQRKVQLDIIELFHYALRPDGWLLLGTSETINNAELFRSEYKKECFFRRQNAPAPEPRLPVFPVASIRFSEPPGKSERPTLPAPYGTMHARMVERYAAPSLLVTPDDKVVHLSEGVGRFLVHPGGELTANVFKLVRQELRIELRGAVHAARQRKQPVRSEPVLVRFEGESTEVLINVRPAIEPQQDGFALVIFEERPAGWVPPTSVGEAKQAGQNLVESTAGDGRLGELEGELGSTRQRLQSIIEQNEISQEEMKASNEELQSANEELRSAMEELETSKEELQSMNEELQTVNQENRHKVAELAQLSSDLQNLLAASAIATLFLDREMRILRFTPPIGELFNVRLVDRSRPLADFTHRLGYAEMLADARQVLKTLIPIEREVQDDQGHWYLTRILPYRSGDDRIEGIVITFVDITQQRRSDELLKQNAQRLKLACEATGFGSYDYSLVTDESVWSPELTEMLGLPESTPADDELLKGLLHPDDREAYLNRYKKIVDPAGTGEHDHQFRVLVDGKVRWLRDVGHTFFFGTGPQRKAVRIVGMVQDVTAQKDYENELNQARVDAEMANQSRGEFLANMSHEIRTPMTAILGHVDILCEELEDHESRQHLETMRRNARYLLEIINDILDLSKIDAGKMRMERARIRLDHLLVDVRSLLKVRSDEKQLEFKVQCKGKLPATIQMDGVRLRQILLNLVGNAIKFTERGAVNLTASYSHSDSQLCFEVSDTGMGIPAEMISQLFEPFIQADAATTRSHSGTGLGLTICRRLARMFGGDISVESELGQGSTFRLLVPYKLEPGVSLLNYDLDQVASEPELCDPGQVRARVLVVDDRRDIRFLTKRLIENAGGTVVEADDGEHAIAIVRDSQSSGKGFDLILLDMQMPLVDGYEAAQRIRQLGYNQPIIALTANAMAGDRHRCLQAGCTDYLSKPIDSTLLLHKIARLTEPSSAKESKTSAGDQ